MSSNVYPLDLESNLGYGSRGRHGFDDITLGYMGSDGQRSRIKLLRGLFQKTSPGDYLDWSLEQATLQVFINPIPSFMQNVEAKFAIPRLSWASTAGINTVCSAQIVH